MRLHGIFLIILPFITILILSGCGEETDNMFTCETDADCIPMPSCHPTQCIERTHESEFSMPAGCPETYIYTSAYEDKDCICNNGKCDNINLRTSYSSDYRCGLRCTDDGYEEGLCMSKKAAKDIEGAQPRGGCWIRDDPDCSENNECNCFCFNN